MACAERERQGPWAGGRPGWARVGVRGGLAETKGSVASTLIRQSRGEGMQAGREAGRGEGQAEEEKDVDDCAQGEAKQRDRGVKLRSASTPFASSSCLPVPACGPVICAWVWVCGGGCDGVGRRVQRTRNTPRAHAALTFLACLFLGACRGGDLGQGPEGLGGVVALHACVPVCGVWVHCVRIGFVFLSTRPPDHPDLTDAVVCAAFCRAAWRRSMASFFCCLRRLR